MWSDNMKQPLSEILNSLLRLSQRRKHRLSARSHPCKKAAGREMLNNLMSRRLGSFSFSPRADYQPLTLQRRKVRGREVRVTEQRKTTKRLFYRRLLTEVASILTGIILDQTIVFNLTGWRKDIIFTRIWSIMGFFYSSQCSITKNLLQESFCFSL